MAGRAGIFLTRARCRVKIAGVLATQEHACIQGVRCMEPIELVKTVAAAG